MKRFIFIVIICLITVPLIAQDINVFYVNGSRNNYFKFNRDNTAWFFNITSSGGYQFGIYEWWVDSYSHRHFGKKGSKFDFIFSDNAFSNMDQGLYVRTKPEPYAISEGYERIQGTSSIKSISFIDAENCQLTDRGQIEKGKYEIIDSVLVIYVGSITYKYYIMTITSNGMEVLNEFLW